MRKALTLLATAAATLPLAGCGGADVPPYTVVDRFDGGNSRDITVEVDSTDNLEAVFQDVIADLDEEGGYFVLINCSAPGGENRLANGRYAIGSIGSAVTGLDEGGTDFSVNEGATCRP